jgi:hypothetical protein
MTVVVDTLGVRTAVDGPAGVGVWVMEGTVGPAAKLAILPTEDRFSMNQPVGTSRVVDLRVVVLGKDHDILTNASTVRELLSAMGIEPDGEDRVLPSPRTPLHPGMSVRYADVELRTRDFDVPIPFTTSTTYSDMLDPGEVRVTEQGRVGLMVETYRVKLVNGEVVGRVLLDRRLIHEAITQRRVIGHRENGSHGTQAGEASWYDAPGTGYTAAHPSLPFGTVVTVTNLSNGESVKVVINDRGPFGGRIIDLSPEAFDAITGYLGQGVCQVRLSW